VARNPQSAPEEAIRTADAPQASIGKSRMHERYQREIVPALVRDFNYKNPMQVPRLAKVSVNVGVGESIANSKALDATVRDVSIITGQKPVIKKARKSIAQFKLREGMQVGVSVTLRGERMWEFLDRLMNAALPRTRDFRGVPGRSFDGRGNFTLGLREQLIFPEISYDQVDKARGLEVSIVTTATTDQEARRLLELLGMPFQRDADAAPVVAARRPSTVRRRRR
jgi:large subunit ribosomal protein L5